MPYDEFLRKRIFEPLGMTDTYFFLPPEKESRRVVIHGRPVGAAAHKSSALRLRERHPASHHRLTAIVFGAREGNRTRLFCEAVPGSLRSKSAPHLLEADWRPQDVSGETFHSRSSNLGG
jgi:CubicO group peptidase (beta-lactamase class C family)